MSKIDLAKELRSYRYEFNLIQRIPCSREENKTYKQLLKESQPLPDGVYQYKTETDIGLDEFYTLSETSLSKDEIAEYFMFKRLSMLQTIKNCVVFFTVIAVLGILSSLFILLSGL